MKKKWGIIDYLVIATIIIILLATSWTDESEMLQFSDRIQKVPLFIKEQKGKWILSSVLIISLTSTFLTNKTIKIIIAILLLITLIITLYFNLI